MVITPYDNLPAILHVICKEKVHSVQETHPQPATERGGNNSDKLQLTIKKEGRCCVPVISPELFH